MVLYLITLVILTTNLHFQVSLSFFLLFCGSLPPFYMYDVMWKAMTVIPFGIQCLEHSATVHGMRDVLTKLLKKVK